MRVVHVGNYVTESSLGVHKTLVGLLSWLPQYGVEVEAWNFTTKVDTVQERRVDGVQIFDLPAYGRPWNFLLKLTPAARAFIEERQHVIDLMHLHSVFMPHNLGLAATLAVPYVVTPHGGYSSRVLQGSNLCNRWFKAAWLQLQEQAYIRKAALIHAVSQPESEHLEKLFERVEVTTIPNAVNLLGLSQKFKQTIDIPKKKNLLFLGRLAMEHKGLDRLIQGYSLFIKDTGDRDTHLNLAGPDYQGDKNVLVELVRSLGIGDRVSFLGSVFGEEKWTLLKSAYAFVQTSRWEGMPFSILEALAVGCPVLITPETNLGDVVQISKAGLVVPGNPEQIAQGIQSLVATKQESYESMSRTARQLIENHFTWAKVTEGMVQVYGEVIEKAGQPQTRSCIKQQV